MIKKTKIKQLKPYILIYKNITLLLNLENKYILRANAHKNQI